MRPRHRAAFVITSLLAVSSPRAAQGVWDTLPPLPVALSNNAVTSVAEPDGTTTFYSFMGIRNPNDSTTIVSSAMRLSWPGGAWEPIAPAPVLDGRPKIAANAVTIDGRVYLIGGYTVGLFDETTEARLFRYEPDSDEYIELAPVPTEVDDTVTAVYQDRYLYLISGWHGPSNDNVPNVQLYDTVTDVWSQATPIPAPLPGLFGHAGGLVDDTLIYLDGAGTVGGFLISDRVFVGQIDPLGVGDLNTIDWAELPAHPGAPTYRAASSLGQTPDGRWLVVGGTDNPYNFNGTGYDGEPSLPLDQVLAFDPATASWETLDIVGERVPTMDHRGLVPFGDDWVVLGGMTGPGVTTAALSRLDLRPAIELAPPEPARAGELNTLVAEDALPGAEVRFLRGFRRGATAVPGCPEAEIEVADARRIADAVADADGRASATGPVPAGAEGRTVFVQAIDRTACVTSNVVEVTFDGPPGRPRVPPSPAPER